MFIFLVFTTEIRDQLKALASNLAASDAALKAYVDGDIKAVNDAVKAFAENNADLFDEEEIVEEETKEENTVTEFNKYAVSTNSVVYEKFENGTTFILNFNNYAIKVFFNGAYYTVGAYGYIVIA